MVVVGRKGGGSSRGRESLTYRIKNQSCFDFYSRRKLFYP